MVPNPAPGMSAPRRTNVTMSPRRQLLFSDLSAKSPCGRCHWAMDVPRHPGPLRDHRAAREEPAAPRREARHAAPSQRGDGESRPPHRSVLVLVRYRPAPEGHRASGLRPRHPSVPGPANGTRRDAGRLSRAVHPVPDPPPGCLARGGAAAHRHEHLRGAPYASRSSYIPPSLANMATLRWVRTPSARPVAACPSPPGPPSPVGDTTAVALDASEGIGRHPWVESGRFRAARDRFLRDTWPAQ
jgi:hypothetical protein